MSIQEQLESVRNNFLADIESFPTSQNEIENLKSKYLGRKGSVASLFSLLGQASKTERPQIGQDLNNLKKELSSLFSSKIKESLSNLSSGKSTYKDFTLPGRSQQNGSIHILEKTMTEIKDIFKSIGFHISYGPEIDDEYHNFTALNVPEHHPARDMQDTFFIKKDPDLLLRTHTSSVQIRHMEENEPPIRTISPGRVYRNEDISARSHCFFHQIEGLYIDENVSFADLKQTLLYFTKELFGKSKIRLRPSYFPFTEPSAEVDIYWGLESETDYRITKGTGWLEIMGCGMIDPNVLDNCKIDSSKYSGFAFGMGIERIAMLLYQIEDIRILYDNDVRFINQFKDSI